MSENEYARRLVKITRVMVNSSTGISLFKCEVSKKESTHTYDFNPSNPEHFAKFVKQTLNYMNPDTAKKIKKYLLENL